MIIKKITEGYVEQHYNSETGVCVFQEFIAQGEVSYEDEDGKIFDIDTLQLELGYEPYDMVQPVS